MRGECGIARDSTLSAQVEPQSSRRPRTGTRTRPAHPSPRPLRSQRFSRPSLQSPRGRDASICRAGGLGAVRDQISTCRGMIRPGSASRCRSSNIDARSAGRSSRSWCSAATRRCPARRAAPPRWRSCRRPSGCPGSSTRRSPRRPARAAHRGHARAAIRILWSMGPCACS